MYTSVIIVTDPNLLNVALYSVRISAFLNKMEETTAIISLLALYMGFPVDSSCSGFEKLSADFCNIYSVMYRPSGRRLLAKLVPTFADRGCHVVSATDPRGR
jgi:hypothetical protein